jgi:SAM-dependent methyltransferase
VTAFARELAQPAADGKSLSRCRICSSARIDKRGSVEFIAGYDWPVFDCGACGCRFTAHDASAYDLLYSQPSSCYSRYAALSATAQAMFDRGDLAGLRAELSRSAKFCFIIERLSGLPRGARILEIGASRGHLAAYFILAGCDVTGVDVSPIAVAAARAAFGDHFVLAGDPRIEKAAPYDAIYHVGTIGCFADPLGATRDLLRLLKPGGVLAFNAPNRTSCGLPGQLWFDSAPPPDLVTMFPPGFWRAQFGDVAQVEEEIENEAPYGNLTFALRKFAGRRWRPPQPVALEQSGKRPAPSARGRDALWALIERAVRKVGIVTRLERLAPGHPSEFGLFVTMLKK